MFYSTKDESILRDGVTLSNLSGRIKHRFVQEINGVLKQSTTDKGKYLRYKNHEINIVEEAIFSRSNVLQRYYISRIQECPIRRSLQ